MKKAKEWPEVALSEIAKPVTRTVHVLPGKSYRTIGVKWWGEGAYERETIDGSRTAAKTLSLVRQGDLIINKIWVRHGSPAIASAAVDGCSASGEFPTFELDPERVFPEWIHWQTKTRGFWAKCDALSRGTSGKNRIKPELFLTIRIPLPPFAEQRQVLSRVGELTTQIAEARTLRKQIAVETEALCRSIAFDSSFGAPKSVPMRELVRLREPDIDVTPDETYQFAGVYCFGGGVFKSRRKSGSEFSYRRLTKLRSGNFVYPKLMAWEGAMGVVPESCEGFFVSPEFPVFDVVQDRALPEFLDTYFRNPSVWPQLAAISTGTNVRRRRLHPDAFLDHEILVPPMGAQQRLRTVIRKMATIKPLQAETAAEIDALLPSVLDQAFKGAL
jgi:type I restriction enzyme, S subunit